MPRLPKPKNRKRERPHRHNSAASLAGRIRISQAAGKRRTTTTAVNKIGEDRPRRAAEHPFEQSAARLCRYFEGCGDAGVAPFAAAGFAWSGFLTTTMFSKYTSLPFTTTSAVI
jgi:hypothetical protein